MIASYAPENPDEPVWLMEETTDRAKTAWWRVRLWTGEYRDFATREEASQAYWR